MADTISETGLWIDDLADPPAVVEEQPEAGGIVVVLPGGVIDGVARAVIAAVTGQPVVEDPGDASPDASLVDDGDASSPPAGDEPAPDASDQTSDTTSPATRRGRKTTTTEKGLSR